MVKNKPSVSSSLFEAMEDFSLKIKRIITNDPDNKVELACLYTGISGINECVNMLKKNGFIDSEENAELQKEIHKLYNMCRSGDG